MENLENLYCTNCHTRGDACHCAAQELVVAGWCTNCGSIGEADGCDFERNGLCTECEEAFRDQADEMEGNVDWETLI